MAVKLVTTIQRWEGRSGDVKSTTSVKEGSQFHEVDTGKKFIYQNGNWIEDISGPINNATFNASHSALRQTVEDVKSKIDFFPDRGSHNFIENR